MPGCTAPSCRCTSPCDEYYAEAEHDIIYDHPELEPCPHCDTGQWYYLTEPSARICSKCGRGDLIVSTTKSTQHTARKVHQRSMVTIPGRGRWESAHVEPGDVYRRDVMLGYEVGGPRFLAVRRTLIRKADPLERLAAILREKST